MPTYQKLRIIARTTFYITRISADADKPARRHVIYIYNRVGRCAAELLRIFYFQKGGRPPSLVFVFSPFLWNIQICAYFYVMQNLVKIVRCAAELLRILYFQNGGRPPSWIWYDVIADHPGLVLDGHIILLKLQVHRVNILRDIEIFKYLARLSWNGLFTPIFGEFWGYDGVPLGFGYQRKGSKTRVLGIPDGWKSFKIGLAVLSQHRRVTDTQPPSQPSFHSKYRATKRRAGKNAIKIRQNCVCPTLSWRSYGHFAFSNPIAASSVTFKFFFHCAKMNLLFTPTTSDTE